MLTSNQVVHTFDGELFQKIASSKKRIPSESRREAWIADTILLLASRLGRNAVLSGGSAVRNITHIMRTTYDIDFDTRINSLTEIRRKLKDVNRTIGVRKVWSHEIGELRLNPERNAQKTFYGMRRMLHMLRRTEKGDLKVHIMHVPIMPEMFAKPLRLELVSIETTDTFVLNVRPEHLFFRKAIRATTERRVEDFVDTYNLLRTGGTIGRKQIIAYAKSKNPGAASKGLSILSGEPEYFAKELGLRLGYVEGDISPQAMRTLARSIAIQVNRVADEISS